ncbi:MAG: type II toxin-antitoxin system PemK/MazF family toxin [Candidatus Glassbacteria bacterium]|nr:type II toxin-antitoxin system PemK/MazF family toxin [Candidatus Glassbacteria bacterium]
MTAYRRGDVVLVNFPYSDLSQVVLRPALIVQDETVSTGFNQWVVVQITTNLYRTGPSRVRVNKKSPAGRKMELSRDSVIMTDKIVTLDDREIHKAKGNCPIMTQVNQALKAILGL